MILSSRWVLPMDGPPVAFGAVRVEGERIASVGSARAILAESDGDGHVDLGHSILMPGLVNAHCHLDYTIFRTVGVGLDFPDWIRELTRLKAERPAESFLDASRRGAEECLRGGITTVADCTDSGFGAQAIHETGLRGIVYPEVFGIDDRHPLESTLADLSDKEERIRPWLSDRVRPGISPHAPYTVRESLFRLLNDRALSERRPLAIHLAESPEETLFLEGLRPWISPIRGDAVRCALPDLRPIPYMRRLGLLRPHVAFIHCIHVTDEEIGELARSGAGVVTCPRSNAFLRTGVAPLRAMLDAGVRLGMGTDGACSSGPLSLFEEMRAAWMIQRSVGPGVSSREAVEMATIGGARALGWDDEIGSIAPDKAADLAALSLDSPAMLGCGNPYDAVALCGGPESVIFTMIGGIARWDPNGLFSGPCRAYDREENRSRRPTP